MTSPASSPLYHPYGIFFAAVSVYFVRRQATRPRRIKNKLTSTTDMPNYLNYLYLDALEAVRPAAVTVIH